MPIFCSQGTQYGSYTGPKGGTGTSESSACLMIDSSGAVHCGAQDIGAWAGGAGGMGRGHEGQEWAGGSRPAGTALQAKQAMQAVPRQAATGGSLTLTHQAGLAGAVVIGAPEHGQAVGDPQPALVHAALDALDQRAQPV